MNITFVGGGNMAEALIGGLLARGFAAQQLRVVEISPARRGALGERHGVACFEDLHRALRPGDIVVFAVKPQHLREAAAKSGLPRNENLVISIAAGVRLSSISRWLGGHTRLVRAMPNTPSLVGAGIAGLCPISEAVSPGDRGNAETILGAVGACVWIERESLMDAVTAVSGSGPAYVFYFIEAVQRAATELGLPAGVAQRLALHTFTGAAQLAATGSDPVVVLRERVTSKGGTTERALASLAGDGVQDAIVRAIRAASARGRELGDELDAL